MTRLDNALAHARAGFFVFPLIGGKKTPPKDMRFKELATRDEAQIRAWWAERDWNIGVYTGRYSDDAALLVVDVDNKGDKHGDDELLRHELEGRDLPVTLAVHTPTGGRHLFYRVGAPVRQGANVLGAGLDVRSKGGYVVAAGSAVGAGEYAFAPGTRDVVVAPDWLVALCGPARTQSAVPAAPRPDVINPEHAVARATHYLLHEAPLSLKGQGGDATAYKVAARVKEYGVDADTALALMLDHWNPRCPPGWAPDRLKQKVDHAYTYGNAPPGAAAPEAEFQPVPHAATKAEVQDSDASGTPFDRLNAEYAFVLAGGGDHILWETTDAEKLSVLVHLNTGSFHRRHLAWEMSVGKRTVPVTEEWMRWKGRRSYDGLVFQPERVAPERFYNLWRGFAVLPSNPQTGGDHPAVTAFLEHARDNVCAGDEKLHRWLIGFFAHLVQRPWEKPLVALVMKGGKGVGKNALVRIVGSLLGKHSITTSDKRYLVGNFNGHMESLLLFTLDEAFWSGDKQAEGRLKDLITGDKHLIEHKGEKVYEVANLTRVVIIGNEDWLVPASHDERRFAVLNVGDGRKGDKPYFIQMREGMEAGGYRHLLRYLMDYDLAGIDVSQAPATRGLLEQKLATLDPFPAWWLTCLHDGRLVGGDFEDTWPGEADCERFRNAFRRYHKERNVRGWVPDDRSMGHQLAKFAPSVGRKRLARGYVYTLPGLDAARKEWDTHIGHAGVWE